MKELLYILRLFKEQVIYFHKEVALDVISLKNIINPKAVIPAITTFFLALNTPEILLVVFLFFYFLDFFTGIIASRYEMKKNPEVAAERKGRKGGLYWVESERVVRGIVKLIIYSQILIIAGIASRLLENKYFILHSSFIPLSLFEIMICLCIIAEFVSNLENGKRVGFDIIKTIQDTIKKVWNIIKLIKTGKTNE